jgi:hypothetical protein
MSSNQTSAERLLLAPVSIGELVDKITILRIKAEFFIGTAQQHVSKELTLLESTLASAPVQPPSDLVRQLAGVNQQLWQIEDSIRDCERRQCFESEFIELARAVYITNDQRAALKKQINLHCGSALVEEKGYASY